MSEEEFVSKCHPHLEFGFGFGGGGSSVDRLVVAGVRGELAELPLDSFLSLIF